MGKATRTARFGVAGALAAALVLAACGGESADGGSDRGAITYASGAASPVFGPAYLAETLGYFDDEGIEVEFVENTGANTGNLMVAGDADVAAWGVGVPIMLSTQGKQAKLLLGGSGVSTSADLIGAPGVEKIEDLRGKRIATLAKGTSTYGAAVYYDKKYDLDAELIVLPDNAAVQSALASGSVQGATGIHGSVAQLVEQGKAVSLVNATDPAQLDEALGGEYVIGGYWAMADTVKDKRDDLTSFVRAIERATTYMRETDATEVAAELRKSEAFRSIPEDLLSKLVAADVPGLTSGLLSQDEWNKTLERLEDWGIDNYDSGAKEIQYDTFVDILLTQENADGKAEE